MSGDRAGKAAVAIDAYKREVMESALAEAGFAISEACNGPAPDTQILTVPYRAGELHRLHDVVRAANILARRPKTT